MEARRDIDAQTVRYTRASRGERQNRTIQWPIFLYVVSSLKLELSSFYQVKRMIEGIGDVLFSTYFLRQVRTLRGAQTHNTHATTHGEGCI